MNLYNLDRYQMRAIVASVPALREEVEGMLADMGRNEPKGPWERQLVVLKRLEANFSQWDGKDPQPLHLTTEEAEEIMDALGYHAEQLMDDASITVRALTRLQGFVLKWAREGEKHG